MWSVVLKPFMKPIWDKCIKLLALTKLHNRLFNREQNNFPRQLTPDLNIKLIKPEDQASRQFPVFSKKFNNFVEDGASIWIPLFNISLRILSGPAAFLDFNNFMAAFVSFSVKGWSRLFYSMKFNSLFLGLLKPFLELYVLASVNAISQTTVQFVCWGSHVSRHRMCFSRHGF